MAHPTPAVHVRRRRKCCAALMATAAVMAATAGCSSEKPSAGPKPMPTSPVSAQPSATAAPSNADPLAAEKEAALDSYQNFVAERTEAYKTVDYKSTSLDKYSSGKAIQQVYGGVQSLRSAGNHMQGTFKTSPEVTKITTSGQLPKATITSCVDVSKFLVIDKAGKTVPHAGQLNQYITVTSLEKWPNGWMIVNERPEGRTCTPRA